MIIDFHTHSFPDAIAEKSISILKANSGTEAFSDGTVRGLSEKASKAGVDLSVVLPVVTNPLSTHKINLFAAKVNESTKETGVFSFGGIHPDTPDVKAEIKSIYELGLKGLKIHPAYQKVYLNDIRYKRIIESAEELGLIVVTHGGLDIGIEGEWSTPEMAAEILMDLSPKRFIMAHMGGWEMWEDVKKHLVGKEIYLDTAFCAVDFAYREDTPFDKRRPTLPDKDFLEIIRSHGADRVLFGTDSPWSDQKTQIDFINGLPLSKEEKNAIFSGNAVKLLNLN